MKLLRKISNAHAFVIFIATYIAKKRLNHRSRCDVFESHLHISVKIFIVGTYSCKIPCFIQLFPNIIARKYIYKQTFLSNDVMRDFCNRILWNLNLNLELSKCNSNFSKSWFLHCRRSCVTVLLSWSSQRWLFEYNKHTDTQLRKSKWKFFLVHILSSVQFGDVQRH